MTSEFFSGSKPSLINSKVLRDINKSLEVSNNDNIIIGGKSMSTIFNDYIAPNTFPLLVLLLIAVYLFIRYLIKKDNEKNRKKETFVGMNPSVPLTRQNNYTRYLPDDSEIIRLNGKNYTYNSVYGRYDTVPDALIDDEYSIDNDINNDDNWDIRTDIKNTWSNETDSDLYNIYGHPHDYVDSTSRAVSFTSEKNRDNLQELTRIMQNSDKDLKERTGYGAYNEFDD